MLVSPFSFAFTFSPNSHLLVETDKGGETLFIKPHSLRRNNKRNLDTRRKEDIMACLLYEKEFTRCRNTISRVKEARTSTHGGVKKVKTLLSYACN